MVRQYDSDRKRVGAGQVGMAGHSELSAPETQHYVEGCHFVAIGDSTGYRPDFRNNSTYFHFDAFSGGHKKSPE